MKTHSIGDQVFYMTLYGGEKPIVVLAEAVVAGVAEGYGYTVRIGPGSSPPLPASFEDVFSSKEHAASAAASRLRMSLAAISAEYRKQIEELESRCA